MYSENILKSDERAVLSLRSLYKSYGYLPFKMSKFEEYDFYARNKDFLISDRVITFNDVNGKLLALKPDVTLSIIKNTTDEPMVKQKVFYNENVFRVSARTHQFKEIMQTGLECIGDIDITDTFEVVYLAAKSLDAVSHELVLDISHMGILSAFLDEISDDKSFIKEITKLISEKNTHEALELCALKGIPAGKAATVSDICALYGDMNTVIDRLYSLANTDAQRSAIAELDALCALLLTTEYADRIRIDFSVVNDMRYYDGIVFKGFLNGISEAVLSGGAYDPLMKRMNRRSKAIGFALYLDALEELECSSRGYDVDVLLIYGDKTKAEEVIEAKNKIISEGKTVYAAKAVPKKIRFMQTVYLEKEAAEV